MSSWAFWLALIPLAASGQDVNARQDGYMHVPGSGGALLHKSCVHEVPEGTVADPFNTTCDKPALFSNEQVYAMDTYTDDSVTFSQMNSSWTVPELPSKASGQVVYFWPGFKATHPEPGYPVLQPVLQYGEGASTHWQLQSWFVWAKASIFPVAKTGKAISVSPGDKITSYMELDATTKTWTVFGKDETTGESSTLQVKNSRVGDYKYAMHVLETVMASSGYCAEYPKSNSVEFTDISANHGQRVTWKTNVLKTDCKQAITVSTTGDDVKMTWESESAAISV